ncbi:MAG: guanylate kinase [Ruminococcus sp.]|jgi:guanylate kinase|nr:guanylate kinase [Ruminococcus sp.]
MNKKGCLTVISAPSGCGKGTVIAEMLKINPALKLSVSATTRPPREDDVDGVDYFFLSRDAFQKQIDGGLMLEYAEYVGNYYGTPAPPVEENLKNGFDVILEIEVVGARKITEKFPDALTVFLMPPSKEELRRRLINRGTDSPEVIEKRLLTADKEIQEAVNFKTIVLNDYAERAADEILELIKSYKQT